MPASKRSLALATLLFFALHTAALAEPLRLMTYNIRYWTDQDGENAWPHRSSLLINVIRDYSPDVLGVQEALRTQLDELAQAFPEYSTAGVGRQADGGGEYSAIFYRRARFDLSDAGTFWLSDAPNSPGSHTWGNNLPRIATWVRLFDRTNDRRFVLFNTHWDHESQPARFNSGRLLAQRIEERTTPDEPVLIMGDFNAHEDNPAFLALTKNSKLLKDTFRVVHPDEKNIGTFNGFGQNMPNRKIDAILATPHWHAAAAAIVRTHEGARYPSDHFPVTATVMLNE